MFLVLGYFSKHLNQPTLKNILLLSVLLIFQYFFHALVFGITVFILISYLTIVWALQRFNIRFLFQKFRLLLSVIPSSILMLFYVFHVKGISGTGTDSLTETTTDLLYYLYIVRQLIAFSIKEKMVNTILFLLIAIAIVIIGIIYWRKST